MNALEKCGAALIAGMMVVSIIGQVTELKRPIATVQVIAPAPLYQVLSIPALKRDSLEVCYRWLDGSLNSRVCVKVSQE